MGSQVSQKYLTARDAASRVGYTGDYVTRLAREGKIEAQKEGRQWMVDVDSLKLFTLQAEAEKRVRSEELREERLNERYRQVRKVQGDVVASKIETSSTSAFLETVAIALCLFLGAQLVWTAVESGVGTGALAAGAMVVGKQMSAAVIDPVPEFFSHTSRQVSKGVEVQNIQQTPENSAGTEPTSADPDFSGVIVITENQNDARRNAIEETFSDEVEVEFDSSDSGVVTPVFREREGDSYRLRLEPTSEQSSENKDL